MQWCHVHFSPEDPCCHGNQPFLLKDKIGCRPTKASNAETQLLGYIAWQWDRCLVPQNAFLVEEYFPARIFSDSVRQTYGWEFDPLFTVLTTATWIGATAWVTPMRDVYVVDCGWATSRVALTAIYGGVARAPLYGCQCPPPTCPTGAYSVTQNSAKMHQNTSFSHQKFSVEGTLSRALPRGEGAPHPKPYPSSAPTTTFWLHHWRVAGSYLQFFDGHWLNYIALHRKPIWSQSYTERHPPYGITQCYLPQHRWTCPALIPVR